MFSINNSYSQVNQKFTSDSLISELRFFYNLQGADLEKDKPAYEKDSVISELADLWNSSISREEKKVIIKIANYQTSRRFVKETTTWNYYRSIIYLKQNNQNNFTPWLSMLSYMSSSSLFTSGKTKNFINNIYNLCEENYLSKTSSAKWKIEDDTNYKFEFDTDKKTFNISVPNTKIEAYSIDNDTIRLFNTSGDYNIIESKWTGKYGEITWEKYGLPSSDMNVKLNKYKINMRKTEFTADSVTYTNKAILKNEILGKINHKALLRAYKKGLFPQFISYRYDYKTKSKLENIWFTSGIEMRGNTLRYIGTDTIPATAEYIKEGKKYLQAKSISFSSLDDFLKSNQANISLYIAEKDSITHPNISMTVKEGEFSFTRNHKGTGNRPFFNSYQKTYISVDNILWNMQDSLIRFHSRLGNLAEFKSLDYFTKSDFTKHRMYETSNPLFDIKKYTRKINSREFYAQDYAAFIRKTQTATIHRLMGLWYEGFIDYNPNTKYVVVRQKLYDYIKYFFDKKDYDVINITSKGKTRKENAELFSITNALYDIKTNQMVLFGVDQVVLNDRKKVGIIPQRQMLVLANNRNMFFSGRLRVGLADFYGNGFSFNYDNYDISFTEIDSLVYRVWDEELTENEKKMRAKFLTSSIENVSGKIRIDVKTNKSGAKRIEQFPKFTCSDTSYVYYDKKNKQGNSYPRDLFFFRNDPFAHDSLLYLTKDNLKITGKMFAGDIFPNFLDTLEVQDDYSLGFLHKVPAEGFPLFKGKGTLSSENSEMHSFIKLSNNGLEANGLVKWNNITIATQDFTFYPDSLVTLADEIEISEFVNQETYAEFPVVTGKLVQTTWDALSDVVRYKTTGIAAEMYDEKVQFSGSFEYRPESLTGNGRAKIKEGTLYADNFSFKKESFLSDKADVKIKGEKSESDDVIIKNMKSFVDIKSEKSVFQKIEDEDSYVNFVNDEYMSYPNHLVWHTGKGKINMNYNLNKFTNQIFSKEQVLLDSAYLIGYCGFDKTLFSTTFGDLKFVSTNSERDSLMFFGSRANYYTGNKKIVTKDVMRIIVADIVVTPSSDVVIDENGEMEKLLKTTVRARGLHNISEVDIQIYSSNKYVASSGIYQYEDMNRKLQNINFDNITYDQNLAASVAHGFVEQHEKFTLNPWFDFYGDVNFNASKDRLSFGGYARLIHSCPSTPQWFYFKSEINPDSVYLPLEPRLHSDIALNKARIFADIMSSKDSIHTFPVFLSTDPYGTSESILSLRDSSYYATYNYNKNRYEIATLEKYNDRTLPGNYLDMKRSTCIVQGEGDITLSKSVKINAFGSTGELTFDTNSDEVIMNTLTYMDFFFSKKALDILTEKLTLNLRLPAVMVQNNSYKKPMCQYLGVEQTDRMLSEMSINSGKPKKFPDKLNKTIVFTNLAFKWDSDSKSYKSIGKIGISNIGNQMINKRVNGHIQIKKRRTGDKIFIYLETAEKEWFFFTFSGGIMRTLSSISEYNQTIADIKTKDKKIKTDRGIFNYMLTNQETKNLFIYEFTGIHPAIDDFEDETEDDDEGIEEDEE